MTTPVAPRAIVSRRIEKGQHYRYCRGHAFGYKGGPKPPRPPRPIVGRSFNRSLGRWFIHCRDGSNVYYYRAVMEAHLRRPLRHDEHVHHINGDSTDDRIENLALVSNAEHRALHADESRENLRRTCQQHIPNEWYLAMVQGWIEAHNRRPQRREFDRDPLLPDSSTYRTRFGSWSAAVDEATRSSLA